MKILIMISGVLLIIGCTTHQPIKTAEETFKTMITIIEQQGYDSKHVKTVPHKHQPKTLVWRT